MKRVMVDQGSGVEIMYPDLYRGMKLKLEDLIAYDSPLVSFDGKVVIPKGQASSEVVEVDFIVVEAYSPYTVRPWLHALGVVSSTLHLKVKYLSRDRNEELVGSQSMASGASWLQLCVNLQRSLWPPLKEVYSNQSL